MLERPWSELLVMLMGATPLIELRGAIPLGLALNLNLGTSLIFALIGNSLVIPIVLLLLPRIIQWCEGWPPFERFWEALERRVRLKGEATVQRYGAIGLGIFVAIPLPGTGAWAGAALAVILGIRRRYALPSIGFGVLTAGILVALIAGGVLAGFQGLVLKEISL
ncbi:small multi-drug export protein [Synechococcus elongatus FACHB-1061]|nr:small multi-drug export protein [Synechococcus elongatus]AJD58755.1 Small multidrug export protein [Synechococcus elongatus UTEX 2973]MBD2588562.1 small multi-drug export protein [Synechococcus elongatus FACHB-242]MBD2689849.1 small multi-drug export protein [Synechococcus elongatus FACHB-1061]MBD2708456.1 small multi-drug export protein [Synechococcus elongatus PCC 7942 = FACHB-805]